MKRLAIVGIAAFVLSNFASQEAAQATDSNLIFVTKDAQNAEYSLDRHWLSSKSNGFIDFVFTKRLPEPDSNGILFIDVHATGHCPTSRLGIMNVQIYNVNDRLVAEKSLDTLDFDVVKPESINFLMLDAACRILKEPR